MNALPDFVTELLTPVPMPGGYTRSMAASLASIVTALLNEHEPMLKAECVGLEITVTEKGGPMVFAITVAPGVPQ